MKRQRDNEAKRGWKQFQEMFTCRGKPQTFSGHEGHESHKGHGGSGTQPVGPEPVFYPPTVSLWLKRNKNVVILN